MKEKAKFITNFGGAIFIAVVAIFLDIIIKNKKRIVSIAKKTRETDCLCSISAVYTIEKERKKGFSKKIVSFLTNYIVTNHKIAYLFVDKNNPISNHLYQSIGYVYDKPQFEFIYQSYQ